MRFETFIAALLAIPATLAVPYSAEDLVLARRQATSCNAENVATIKSQKPHPKIFCNNYAAGTAPANPITGLTGAQISAACVCIVSAGTSSSSATGSITSSPTSTSRSSVNPESAVTDLPGSSLAASSSSVAVSSLSAAIASVTFSQVGVLSTTVDSVAAATSSACVAGQSTHADGNVWQLQCKHFFNGTITGTYPALDLASCQSSCSVGLCAGVVFNPSTKICRKYSSIESSAYRPPFIAAALMTPNNATLGSNSTITPDTTSTTTTTTGNNTASPITIPSLPLPTTNGVNTELLVNGGFQTGDIPPWVASITSNMNLEVTDGTGVDEPALFAHFHVQRPNKAQIILTQGVQMYQNDTFHFTSVFYFGYGTGLPTQITCDAAWYMNSTYYELTEFNATSGTSYEFAIDGLTTVSGITDVNIYLGCVSSGQSVDFPIAIDDVSLVANWADTRPEVYSSDVDARFVRFFSGSGVVQYANTTGDNAALTSTLRVGDESAAIQSCADKTGLAGRKAFDLHYSNTTQKWICVQYPQAWQSPSLFSIQDTSVGQAYGYFLHSDDPTQW